MTTKDELKAAFKEAAQEVEAERNKPSEEQQAAALLKKVPSMFDVDPMRTGQVEIDD